MEEMRVEALVYFQNESIEELLKLPRVSMTWSDPNLHVTYFDGSIVIRVYNCERVSFCHSFIYIIISIMSHHQDEIEDE